MNSLLGEDLDGDVRIDRVLAAAKTTLDQNYSQMEQGIRPRTFAEYPGQDFVKENLKTYVSAAKIRGTPLDHVILHGPPGLGKTTLAQIIANELGVGFVPASGPSIDKPGDLAGILAGLAPNSILFIDEIHRLNIQVEEVLYSAMEDFTIDIVVGQGPTARTMKVDLCPFTLLGATTKLSLLSRPFLSRFGIQEKLSFYNVEALAMIVSRSAALMGIAIDAKACQALAARSRGTPRIVNRLLRRAWDFALVDNEDHISVQTLDRALYRLDVDAEGLDRMDRQILEVLESRYKGGPVGLEALAICLGEEKSTIEEVYEPYLVHSGFIARSARGRVLTDKARSHLDKIGRSH